MLRAAARLSASLVFCLAASAGAQTVFTSDTTISAANGTFEGQDIIIEGCIVTIDGPHAFQSLTIRRNAQNQWGVLTHTPRSPTGGLDLTIAGDVLVEGPVVNGGLTTSYIYVVGRGYDYFVDAGPSAPMGWFLCGGGHGGPAGTVNGVPPRTNGNWLAPVSFGSAGSRENNDPFAWGGSGGGAVKIVAGGTITINGSILADGVEGNSAQNGAGGGAGGSIWLNAPTVLVGASAKITARGAPGINQASSGGGGRILIESDTPGYFGAPFSASGGAHVDPVRSGAPGTMVSRTRGGLVPFELMINNSGVVATTQTRVPELTHVMNLGIRAGASFKIPDAVTVDNLFGVWGYDYGNSPSSPCSVEMEYLGVYGAGTIHNAYVTHPAASPKFYLNCPIRLTLSSTTISADAKGYPAGTGPGHGTVDPAQGGGYGGQGGGTFGGNTYTTPGGIGGLGSGGTGPSSYGWSGAGGGGIAIATQTLWINDSNVTISANGQSGGGSLGQPNAGGSGGCISIIADNLNTFGASARISANGGNAEMGGGAGGGGRIQFLIKSSILGGYFPTFTAFGGRSSGAASQQGGAGTIAIQRGIIYDPYYRINGSFIVDNGGVVTDRLTQGAPPLQFGFNYGYAFKVAGGAFFDRTGSGVRLNEPYSLTIDGPSRLRATDVTASLDLNLLNGGTLFGPALSTLNINAGTLEIDSVSSITMYGAGYAASQGPGAGSSSGCSAGSGGSHGGLGGGDYTRPVYDDPANPTLPGSGGSGWACNTSYAGAGGGVIKINCRQTARVFGLIDARGSNASYNSGGGGSGGSIQLASPTLYGSGHILASGGAGIAGNGGIGGGGGGGRIKYSFCDSGTFFGTFSVDGGTSPGGPAGQPGSFYAQGQSFVVTDQPGPTSCAIQGKLLTLSVTTSGWADLTYQWAHDGIDLVDAGNVFGATSPVLNLVPAHLNDAGTYTCTISSALCTYTTSPSALTVFFSNADFDGDGSIDFFDYDTFVACFEGGPCPPDKNADFDGDGTVDFFDYDAFVVAFELGC